MTREDILKEILSLKGNNLLLELPTGVGKTKLSIEKIKQLKGKNNNKNIGLIEINNKR